MASPVDSVRTDTGITTAATSFSINLGSPVAGETILVAVLVRTVGATLTFTGYTLLTSALSTASLTTGAVYYRKATGTEGATATLTSTGSGKCGAVCWRITGAADPTVTAPESSAGGGVGAGQQIQSPALSPSGGLHDYLFFSIAGYWPSTGTPTTAPTGYSNLTTGAGSGGSATTQALVTGSSKQATEATETPGAYSGSGTNISGGSAVTVAVYPAPPPVLPQTPFQNYLFLKAKTANPGVMSMSERIR